MTIDDMLSQPLPPVPDNGFSTHVAGRIRAANRRRMILIAAASAAAASAGFFMLPMETITAELNAIVIGLGSSVTVGLAGAALFLTILADRHFFRI